MRNKKILTMIGILAITFALSACMPSDVSESDEQNSFELTVSDTDMEGKIFQEMELSKAVATDSDGKDISDSVVLTITFIPDNTVVAEILNGEKFTPEKVGYYLVEYEATNKKGDMKRLEADLNVYENPEYDSSRIKNKTLDAKNWVLDGKNSKITQDGIIIGQSNAQTEVGDMSSVAYAERKVDDEIVKLNFTINGTFGNQMYVVGAKSSKGYNSTQPTQNEAVWPTYYFIRILQTKISVYGSVYKNQEVLLGEIPISLYDGKNHTFAYIFDDNGAKQGDADAKITCKIWIDTDVNSTPTFSADVQASQLGYDAAGNRDPQLPALYGSESAGWAFVGAVRNVANDDYMLLQGFSIGDECFVQPPYFYLDDSVNTYLKGDVVQLPEAVAVDRATHESLNDSVSVQVTAPDGNTFEYKQPFEAKVSGKYVAYYSVSDKSGNKTSRSFRFNVLNAAEDSVAPVLQSDTESLTVQVGTPFALPKVQANDNLDGDLSADIQLVSDGPEGRVVKDLSQEYVSYFAGNFNLRYFVQDLNGNVGEKIISVQVTQNGREDNLANNAENWYSTNNPGVESIFSLGKTDGSSLTYKQEMVYEQKVSLKIAFGDPFVAVNSTEAGVKDLLISLRGGFENYGYAPGTPQNSAFTWPNNFSIVISSVGIHLFLNNEQLTQSFLDFSTELANSTHTITYQVKDMPNNLIQLILQIDGKVIQFPGGDSTTGAYYINKADDECYSKATWLNVFTYGAYPSEHPSEIKILEVKMEG